MAPQHPDDLLDRARRWAAEDPDAETRAELEALTDAAARDGDAAEAARADLADRFSGTLEFGTAGLRGALGAGPMRMNRVVVTRAAAGLAAYLRDTGSAPGSSVVIGYDARRNSDVFARDTAEVMTGAGFRALVLPEPLPTPVLAFAIRHLGAVAGVMVTASHNPPQDNGYKVYLGDGSQIVPPADAGIAERIAAVGPLADVPRGDAGERLDDSVVGAYVDAVASLLDPAGPREVVSVYTPLHGVGGAIQRRVLEATGFTRPHAVDEQAEPDPDFPTVAFPNPEEPGAMDLALALAEQQRADLIVAHDPDADRCAVGVPTPDSPHPWRMLRGDELGALLGDHLARSGREGVYAASIVSSSLLGRIAADAGQPYEQTLTGFKWIGRVPGLAFGYEEALGYCVAPHVAADKDGISAGLLVLDLAARLKADGLTLLDRLDEIARRHGLHATDQLSVRVSDLSLIGAAMARLRATPPDALGGLAVERVDDLTRPSDGLPPTDGLRFALADGARVVVRPSGTEPKLKCYLEVVVAVEADVEDGVEAARISAAGRLDAIRGDLAGSLGLETLTP
ncbi:phospho-sugar mutase [Nocardioides sp. HDW12B]|nr:phospho-sugar mutase [Nocardioides sp. HDW12B]